MSKISTAWLYYRVDFTTTKEAIEADDIERVSVLVESILDQFDHRRNETEAATSLASRVAEHTETHEDLKPTVEQFFTASSNARQARLEVGQVLLGYINGGTTKEAVIEAIDRTIDAESKLTDAIENVSNVDLDVEFPPVLAVVAPNEMEIQMNHPLTQEITIRNLGGQTATDTTVNVHSELPLEVNAPTIGEIDPEESIDAKLTGTVHSTGEYTVTVDVVAENARARAETAVVVANRSMYLSAAKPQIRELRDRVVELQGDTPDTPPGNSGLKGMENKLRTAEKRVGKVLRVIKDGTDEEEVGKQIGAINNLLQTVIKQSRALTGTQLTEGDAAIINRDTEGIIETLNRAIDAGQ